MNTRSDSHLKGAIYFILSTFAFSIMTLCIRKVSEFPLFQIVFFRCFVAFMVVCSLIIFQTRYAELRTTRIRAHLFRWLCGMTAMLCFFNAYKYLQLSDVSALRFSMPIFLVILSALLLSEKVGIHRWSAVVIGLFGVLIIINPSAGIFHPAAFIVLAGTVSAALAMMMLRKLAATESSLAIVFYFMGLCTLISSIFLPFFWIPPTLLDLAFLAGTGISGVIGQFLLVSSYKHAEASFIAPLEYTAIFWAILFDYLFWSEPPNAVVMSGATIIIASNLYMFKREQIKAASKLT